MSEREKLGAIIGSVALGALLCALVLFWEAGGKEGKK